MALSIESIDARSYTLMQEFVEHWEKIQATHPEMTDKLIVFSLWQTQKIAGLQEICLELAKRLMYLTEIVLDETDPTYGDLIVDLQSGQAGAPDTDWIEALAGEDE